MAFCNSQQCTSLAEQAPAGLERWPQIIHPTKFEAFGRIAKQPTVALSLASFPSGCSQDPGYCTLEKKLAGSRQVEGKHMDQKLWHQHLYFLCQS